MAQSTNQEISMKLTVQSEGFKKELLEAQKELYKLEAAGVKAAGGQEKYNAAVKKARLAIKQANGAYRAATTSLKLNEIQAVKTAKATVKLGKKQKQMNASMTQLAYALDDMQYGFQGVQNNIQAMAVSLGLSGPLIIGITAVVASIGYFTKQMKAANKEIKAQRDALKEKQGLIASMLTHAEVVRNSTKETITYKESLKKLKDNGYDPLTQSLNDYTDALIRQKLIESKLEANQGKIKDLLADRIKLNNELQNLEAGGITLGVGSAGVGAQGPDMDEVKKRINNAIKHKRKQIQVLNSKIKDEVGIGADLLSELANTTVTDKKKGGGAPKDDGVKDGVAYSHGFLGGAKATMVGADIYKNIKDGINEVLELQKAGGATKSELLESELAQLQAIDTQILSLNDKEDVLHRIKVLQAEIANMPGMTDSGIGLNVDDKKFIKFKSDIAEVNAMFEAGLFGLDEYIRRIENLSTAFEEFGVAKQETSKEDEILAQGMSNLVSGFAEAAGSGTDIGKALLSGIGNTLMQLGGLLITTGIGIEAFKTSLRTLKGPVAIAAGAAMVAAGAAFASAANSAGGGGGGGSVKSSSSVNSVASPNPIRESSGSARNRGSDIVIPVDQIRYGMQIGESNYGSSS